MGLQFTVRTLYYTQKDGKSLGHFLRIIVVLLIFVLFVWWPHMGLFLCSALKDYYWKVQGSCGMLEVEPSWLHTRQVPYSMYYLFSPKVSIFVS